MSESIIKKWTRALLKFQNSIMRKKIFSKLKSRLKSLLIAQSVIRSNPIFSAFSYQLRLGRSNKLDKKHSILVIGCSGDIGASLCSQLLRRGCEVYGTYFKNHHSLSNLSPEKTFKLDITSPSSIEAVFNKFESLNVSLDTIIIASGHLKKNELSVDLNNDEINRDKLKIQSAEAKTSFEINALGPYLVARAFAKLLRFDQRIKKFVPQICVLTSSIGTMHNEIYGGMYSYRASKAALHAVLMALYCDLRQKNKVGILMAGPGSVKTKMNPYGNLSTNQSANYIIDNIEHASSSAKFQFLGLKGKRITW